MRRPIPTRMIFLAMAMCATLAVTVCAQETNDISANLARNMTEAATSRTTDAPGSSASAATHPSIRRAGRRIEMPHAPQLLKDFAEDQRELWTSPMRLRFRNTTWLVPLGGFTAGLFATDSDFSRHLSRNPQTLSHYNKLSNAGVAALVGGAGGMWVLSHFNHNVHWRETGFLAGEATLHSLLMTETLKYSMRRARPYQGDGTGAFFQGRGTSFPSEHSAAAWSVASVVAHEYPGPLTKILAYGAASLVSYSRVRAEKHFPSDVVVGALLGQLAAHQVYSRRHDPELGGDVWSDPAHFFFEDGHSRPGFVGSPYVPLDSWIYPALDRLAAMGLIDSGFAGLRPWTRRECARLLGEAEDKLTGGTSENETAAKLVESLQHELRPEAEAPGIADTGAFKLESLYSRTEYISGMPLSDGYDFAQSQINDFGRPYAQGWNTVTGFSSFAAWGPWVGYVRGEFQTAPSIPALPLSARQFVASWKGTSTLPSSAAAPPVRQFELLEAYTGLAFANWQASFGRQSLNWGIGEGGSLDLSHNAPPIDMFRMNRVSPAKLPGILGWLGPMRTEFFIGQLAGQEFVFNPSGLLGQWGQPLSPQPLIHGQSFFFKPTPNFEFGFFRTTIYGGPGYPLTWHTLIRSLFTTANENAGGLSKPGNRTSAMEFSYRLPRLRDWVTFYGEAYTDDQFSPIAYMDRSAWHAGLYFPRFPRLTNLDLRLEGVFTDVPPGGGPISPGQFYFNGTWRSGYTNKGYLLGSWVGRGGQGAQAWTNYWFTAKDRLQVSFRHQKVSQEFLPGGGTLTDLGVRGDYWLRSNLGLSASVQYENWLFPVIHPGAEKNVTASFEVQFHPQKLFSSSIFQLAPKSARGGDSN